ncbi:MAG: hypothetical protein FRX49_08429 [Trebouxia sp. A1-2]|nr:MAG: hypothetical protein FRX49_08429 [Trebouxia sp. A1-2]
MLIFTAHNGKTLELDVQSSTRVDAVQLALSSLTSIPPQEQILLLNGNPLDPGKPLGAYQLPTDDIGNHKDVFLYNKAHLRQNVAIPVPEATHLPRADVPPPGSIQYEPHALDSAPSPLLQTLPNYERQFRYHLQKAQAHLEVSQQREAICRQLLSEQEVQAMAIDAARMNVEHHYQYIARAFEEFIVTYQTEAAAQKDILQGFERDMEQLASLQLHAGARTERHSRLIHLIPEQKMRDWAARCKHDHDHFAKKVGELKATFGGLKLDVEAMFMQMPSVDLDELGGQLEAMQHHQAEQASIVDVLQSDLAKIESLVEEAVRQLSSAASSSSVRPLDACEVMEAMNRHHLGDLLPRIEDADKAFEQLCNHCVGCKNCMTKDVFTQLQKISTQQSKIRTLKGKLAVYQDVANKQAETFAELQLVKRVPVAYRHCLAECMRRQSFWESYKARLPMMRRRAWRLRRNKEAGVLTSMGLLSEVPLCNIKLSSPDAALLQVDSDDLMQLPKSPQGQVHAVLPFPDPRRPQPDLSASQALQPIPGTSAASQALTGTLAASRQTQQAAAEEEQGVTDDASDQSLSREDELMLLRAQNAKLRDQIATLVFQQCLSENPSRQIASDAQQPLSPSLSSSHFLRADSGPGSAPGTSSSSLARNPSGTLAQSTLFRAPSGASQLMSQLGQQGVIQTRASQAVSAQQLSQQMAEERRKYGQAVGAKDDRIRELDEQLKTLKQTQQAEGNSYKNRIRNLESLLNRVSLSASSETKASPQIADPQGNPQVPAQGVTLPQEMSTAGGATAAGPAQLPAATSSTDQVVPRASGAAGTGSTQSSEQHENRNAAAHRQQQADAVATAGVTLAETEAQTAATIQGELSSASERSAEPDLTSPGIFSA